MLRIDLERRRVISACPDKGSHDPAAFALFAQSVSIKKLSPEVVNAQTQQPFENRQRNRQHRNRDVSLSVCLLAQSVPALAAFSCDPSGRSRTASAKNVARSGECADEKCRQKWRMRRRNSRWRFDNSFVDTAIATITLDVFVISHRLIDWLTVELVVMIKVADARVLLPQRRAEGYTQETPMAGIDAPITCTCASQLQNLRRA